MSAPEFKTIPIVPGTTPDMDEIAKEYLSLSAEMKTVFYGQLSKGKQKQLTKKIKEIPVPEATDDDDDSSDEDFPDPSKPLVPTPPTTKNTNKPAGSKVVISDADLRDMWTIIESMSSSELDPNDLKVFEYEGFNPSAILSVLMVRRIEEGISIDQFKKDVMTMCGIAIIKGNVNDNNFKKMKKEGQDLFLVLQERYTIKLGSAKGMDANVVTIARIGASFPGTIIDLLMNEKVSARVFGGPMKSSKLPGVMRHQAMAACIPSTLDDDAKNFLLAVICAFSIDQSLTISSKRKPKKEDVAVTQANFIRVAHNSSFPSEAMRKAIFLKVNWVQYFELMQNCAKEVEKLDETFGLVDIPTLKAAINKL